MKMLADKVKEEVRGGCDEVIQCANSHSLTHVLDMVLDKMEDEEDGRCEG